MLRGKIWSDLPILYFVIPYIKSSLFDARELVLMLLHMDSAVVIKEYIAMHVYQENLSHGLFFDLSDNAPVKWPCILRKQHARSLISLSFNCRNDPCWSTVLQYFTIYVGYISYVGQIEANTQLMIVPQKTNDTVHLCKYISQPPPSTLRFRTISIHNADNKVTLIFLIVSLAINYFVKLHSARWRH